MRSDKVVTIILWSILLKALLTSTRACKSQIGIVEDIGNIEYRVYREQMEYRPYRELGYIGTIEKYKR